VSCEPVTWADGTLRIIDQTRLPRELIYVELPTAASVWDAIKTLQVRGAPAIGVCAAFGVLVGLRETAPATAGDRVRAVHQVADYLGTSRPTAVNLFWALDRMRRVADAADTGDTAEALGAALEREACAILAEDIELGHRIGAAGAALIREGAGVLTHCNAGALATGGAGTALAVIYHAHVAGRRFQVYADETRPLLQGARLTAWELHRAGIPVTLICDNMAAQVMREGRIDLVIVGADRVARNGDAANKIGTYGLAVLARAHGIPFYIAIPSSTLDPALNDGTGIPIEQRAEEEITAPFGYPIAPEGIGVYNPAFDVTPASLITGIITEHGIMDPPFTDSLCQLGTAGTQLSGAVLR
jgi:methylthioribose-1-phosphate isomerase